ncbi:hypothetical protein QQP08_006476 [Theobroma cacao]|nr:hypothetical protein QQP08_006476 [Theobroma cacao]
MTFNQTKNDPSAMSRYPIWSPPKKGLPWLNFRNASSNSTSPSSTCAMAAFLASSDSAANTPLKAGNHYTTEKQEKRNNYENLFNQKRQGSPKSRIGTFIRIGRKNGTARGPDLIDVLDNDERLTDRLVTM